MNSAQKRNFNTKLMAELMDGGGYVEHRRGIGEVSVAFRNAAIREEGREYGLGEDSLAKMFHLVTDCISPRAQIVIYGGGKRADRILSWTDQGDLSVRLSEKIQGFTGLQAPLLQV